MKKLRRNASLREKLSLTQQDFADYLGVTRTLVTLNEQGQRSLPMLATLKAAELELLLNNLLQQNQEKGKRKPLHPAVQQQHEKARKAMQAHADRCKHKKTVLEYKLKKMMVQHSRAETCLQLLAKLLSTTPVNKENKEELLWLDIQQHNAERKVIRFGRGSQARLQAQIETLGTEQLLYMKWKEQIE